MKQANILRGFHGAEMPKVKFPKLKSLESSLEISSLRVFPPSVGKYGSNKIPRETFILKKRLIILITNSYYFVTQQVTYHLSTLLSSSCTTVISTFCISASGFAWAKSNDTARRNAWYSSKPISLACRLYACQKRSECVQLQMLNTNKEKDAMIEVLLSEIKNISVLQHWLDNENWILLDCPIINFILCES